MTATVTPATTGSAAATDTGSGVLRALTRHRGRLIVAGAAVALVLGAVFLGAGNWPASLSVDLSGPLKSTSDWIIDNRDGHPLFLYFLGHVSNAVVVSVRAVYLVLLALGWAGVTAAAALVAWRVAGVRLALTSSPPSPSAECSACGSPPCRRSP